MDDSFYDLMARLKEGDDDAARAVFNRFARRLIGLARSRLDGLLRAKVQPEDILQSVFRSFFARHADAEFELRGWDSLWGLLTTLTVRKCGRQHRFFRQERRDVRREVSKSPVHDDDRAPKWEEQDSEPLPEEAAMLTETVQELLAAHGERDRHIIVLSLQGCDTADVSAQVGCTQRTVQRVLERLRERLQRWNTE